MVVQPLHADAIGDITELKGYGQVLRDEPYPASLNFDINSYDNVETADGRIGITFLDDSQVRLTEHSELTIDEYIFDPNPDKSKMSLSFNSGTIRFLSGSVNKLNKKNISLSTPSSEIAVLIILLPGLDGLASGEIVVSTATGQVRLNKPYQATTTSVYEQNPTTPITLDISLELIDNMLIVSPPKEKESIEQERQTTQKANILDFNELDVDYLQEDLFSLEEDLDFTELDIDYLDVNFLEDLLDSIDELSIKDDEDELNQFISAIPVSGTRIGQDAETQITTILEGDKVRLIRNVNQNVSLVLNSDETYSVLIIQDGVSNIITINNGSSSVIRIRQESG